MRVMVIVKANEETEAGGGPNDEQMFREMGAYNDELIKAGIMLAGEGLHPSAKGVRVYFDGTKRTVVDGPFAETKELIAGFWLWQVKSMAEAVEWAKRCPNTGGGQSQLELRPVGEMDDLGPDFTPELKAQEERQRAEIAAQQKRK